MKKIFKYKEPRWYKVRYVLELPPLRGHKWPYRWERTIKVKVVRKMSKSEILFKAFLTLEKKYAGSPPKVIDVSF